MKKGWMLVIFLFIIIVVGVVALIFIPGPNMAEAPAPSTTSPATTTATSDVSELILVSNPTPNQHISSPLGITGKARGNWYFEATFPIELIDANGKVIAQGAGRALSDWTTTDFVPFSTTLSFPAQPAGSRGTLVLTNDNPSGDPTKQKELDVPVQF
ncbi:MAG TPA: Gmad2 immunoglobulin-like domain-containing protein [Candidatus Paceibacterota bacterium]